MTHSHSFRQRYTSWYQWRRTMSCPFSPYCKHRGSHARGRHYRLTPRAQIHRNSFPQAHRLVLQGCSFRHLLYLSHWTLCVAHVVQSEARALSARRCVWEHRGSSTGHQGKHHFPLCSNHQLTSGLSPSNRPLLFDLPLTTSPCPLCPMSPPFPQEQPPLQNQP